jgi:hypothetical protein
LVGDAAGFIDPFFSTGVHLALLGALSAAATICAERRGELGEHEAASYHEKLIRRAYLRLMLAVAGAYQRIRSGEHSPELRSVAAADFERAFEILQPLISGDLDARPSGISGTAVEEVMDYLGNSLLEAHGLRTDSRIARVLSERILEFDIHDIRPSEAIDGLYINMQRGALGLARVGGAATVANALRRGVAKIGLRATALSERGQS